jgi:hypothetical protein
MCDKRRRRRRARPGSSGELAKNAGSSSGTPRADRWDVREDGRARRRPLPAMPSTIPATSRRPASPASPDGESGKKSVGGGDPRADRRMGQRVDAPYQPCQAAAPPPARASRRTAPDGESTKKRGGGSPTTARRTGGRVDAPFPRRPAAAPPQQTDGEPHGARWRKKNRRRRPDNSPADGRARRRPLTATPSTSTATSRRTASPASPDGESTTKKRRQQPETGRDGCGSASTPSFHVAKHQPRHQQTDGEPHGARRRVDKKKTSAATRPDAPGAGARRRTLPTKPSTSPITSSRQ